MNAKAEKVARMFGKTAYKDFRQGFAQRMVMDADTDADIKAALGMAQKAHGVVAVMALETHYAGTLVHEQLLRRAWDDRCGKPDDPSTYAVRRLGCSIAIREHAGAPMSRREVSEWAWILHTRYETVTAMVRQPLCWLEDITSKAAGVFVAALREDD